MTRSRFASIEIVVERAGYDTQIAIFVGMPRQIRLHFAPLSTRANSNMDPSEIEQLIKAGFEDAVVKVASDDNTHFEALVVAAEFDGKRPIARHQLVYRCLGKLVGNEIHALSIKALTPDEWRAAGEGQPLG